MKRTAFLLLAFGCGAEQSSPATSEPAPSTVAPAATISAAPGVDRDQAVADKIVSGWPMLWEGHLHAVYLARVTSRTTAGGVAEWCARPERRARAKTNAPQPTEICTPVPEVIGHPRGWDSFTTGPPAWVATAMHGPIEKIAVLAANDCGGSPCQDVPQDVLVEVYRCGQLERLWAGLPAEHRGCFEDRACVLLESACFESAVSQGYAERYQEVIRRYGAVCLDPRAGVCAAEEHGVRCDDGKCVAVER